ncbi:hypothetical protein [Bradyrhizobium sp. OAE829]|uniref:hypothetical protein n=1 Tax=Bradyrhizobium sp. OAE829 TaxID=2663807 RepID=UPI0019E093E1
MLRCTGTATSTFGGGGGTKVFCSQALKTPNAAMAKTARHAMAPLCLKVSCGLLHASERSDFICVPQYVCSCKARSIQIMAFDHPIKIATIHLQGNPKPKMMPRAKFSSLSRS